MCHSSARWTFWSRRQQEKTTEPVNRSEATSARAEPAAPKPAVDPREDERIQPEKELERLY